jgi:hypothetical protein
MTGEAQAAFNDESRLPSPPICLQSLMVVPLWAMAKVVGVRPRDDRWDRRI